MLRLTWMPLRTLGLGALIGTFGYACSSSSSTPAAASAATDGGDVASDTGAAPDADDSATTLPEGGGCSAAAAQLLPPVDKVSSGTVSILSEENGIRTLFVDASAGGLNGDATNPRIYIELQGGSKVAVTDVQATTSTAWDLALKRPILFTNSGDGGPGQGGALVIEKDFDQVTSADAAAATLATEVFFDPTCGLKVDETGAVKTTFTGWYDYNQSNNTLSPAQGTWIVRSAMGALYKVAILSYYANPDGGVGTAGGRYTLKVGAL